MPASARPHPIPDARGAVAARRYEMVRVTREGDGENGAGVAHEGRDEYVGPPFHRLERPYTDVAIGEASGE